MALDRNYRTPFAAILFFWGGDGNIVIYPYRLGWSGRGYLSIRILLTKNLSYSFDGLIPGFYDTGRICFDSFAVLTFINLILQARRF